MFFYKEKSPKDGDEEKFYLLRQQPLLPPHSQFAASFSQFGELKTGPKPQQLFGSAEGENISNGKRIFSKLRQGSAGIEPEEVFSGRQFPREWTTIFTVRNSLIMVNRPTVTLTATGAPKAASPLVNVGFEQSQGS